MGKRIHEWKWNFYMVQWNAKIRNLEKWKVARVMSKGNYLNKIKELPEHIKQFSGLVILVIVVLSSFFVLNIMFGEGDELVKKMKIEEERIAEEKKLNTVISSLPSGIVVFLSLIHISDPRDRSLSRMPSSA